MTGSTGLRRFGVPVTAVTGGRINATVDHMPGKIVTAMGHAAVIFSLVFDGRFQLDADAVAIAAETCPVTGGAYRTIAAGHLVMIVGKKHSVDEFFIGNLSLFRLMTIEAKAQIFPLFCRMPGGWRVASLKGGTGN